MHRGFFPLYRKFKENFLWQSSRLGRNKFSKFEAWLDILTEARFQQEPKPWLAGNMRQPIMIEQGQVLYSLETWATRWHWSKSTTREYLKMLESRNMIKYENLRTTVRLTVCNYESYNSPPTEDGLEPNREQNENSPGLETKHKLNKSAMTRVQDRNQPESVQRQTVGNFRLEPTKQIKEHNKNNNDKKQTYNNNKKGAGCVSESLSLAFYGRLASELQRLYKALCWPLEAQDLYIQEYVAEYLIVKLAYTEYRHQKEAVGNKYIYSKRAIDHNYDTTEFETEFIRQEMKQRITELEEKVKSNLSFLQRLVEEYGLKIPDSKHIYYFTVFNDSQNEIDQKETRKRDLLNMPPVNWPMSFKHDYFSFWIANGYFSNDPLCRNLIRDVENILNDTATPELIDD